MIAWFWAGPQVQGRGRKNFSLFLDHSLFSLAFLSITLHQRPRLIIEPKHH
jgi:hypothetical protein